MKGSEEELQKIVDLLVAEGYTHAQSSSLPPFDKLIAGLAWCITACNVDIGIDLFYDSNASLAFKLKVCDAIEWALQKMECPHPLHAQQIQDLVYSAVYPVVQWLVKHVLSTTQEMFGDQSSSLTGFLPKHLTKGCTLSVNAEMHLKHKAPPSPASDRSLSEGGNLSSFRVDCVNGLHSQKPSLIESFQMELADAESCQLNGLLKRIAEAERTNDRLQEQKKDLAAQIIKTEDTRKNQDREESELFLEMKTLKETAERAGAGELLQKLFPLLKQSKTIQEEELSFQSSSEQKHKELLTIIEKLETYQERENDKAEVENMLQENFLRLKLLKGDMAKKNQKFTHYRRKLDELPSQSELMQYERCFVELYLLIQAKLQETRKYFATYNALAEANELTMKEISLLNSINAQFEEVMASQEGRSKFVASMSNIAKGVSQKVEKVEARFLAEQNALSLLKKRHSQQVAERRRYENLMQLFQEECTKNELLRLCLHQDA